MTGYITNSPRNRYTGTLADTLSSAKAYGDQYEVSPWVPLLGGTGLGTLFMGKAPELVDDVSYQGLKALYRGGNLATGGIGTFQPDKRTFDAAMLGLDAAGITKGLTALGNLGEAGLNRVAKAADKRFSQSRRDFLKKSAALGGTAAIGGLGLGALRQVGKETGEQVATAAPSRYRFNTLNEYLKDVEARAEKANPYDGRPISEIRREQRKSNILQNDAAMYKAAKNPNDIQSKSNAYRLTEFSPQAKAEMSAAKRAIKDYTTYPPGTTMENLYQQARTLGHVEADSIPRWKDVIFDYAANPNYLLDRKARYLDSFNIDDIPF